MEPFTYKIIHDYGIFISENILTQNIIWKEVILSPITSIELFLPDSKSIFMKGYDSYNLFIEALQDISGTTVIDTVYLLGKNYDVVNGWKITHDSIIRISCAFGEEYYGTPSIGWKHGKNHNDVISIIL